eukprot:TRINITY_DN13681_c0_g1_i2.p2 TRINITY_DN13681_c0_g1~~TRINITY_DN13681_c0_g1_i2.p2  ORF type:complete len:384 (+),score=64.45 TRINITY_DN13681_c0_g1_i2:65-1216(+)
MGQAQQVPFVQYCPKENALRDCGSANDRGTDTVKVDLSKLASPAKAPLSRQEPQESPENTSIRSLRACADSCPPPPAPALRENSVSEQEQTWTVKEANTSRKDGLQAPELEETLHFDVQPVVAAMSRSEAPQSPEAGRDEAEVRQIDIESVIAAMSASVAQESMQLPQPAAEPSPLGVVNEEACTRQRSSSLATQEEPEAERPASVGGSLSLQAPTPEAVPSPGGLLLKSPAGTTGRASTPSRTPQSPPQMDESRVRRASQFFGSMLRGEACSARSRQRSRRRKSEPPRKECAPAVVAVAPAAAAAVDAAGTPDQGTLPRQARASSVDSASVHEAPVLRPLNGQMPWFPAVESPKKERFGRPRSRVPGPILWPLKKSGSNLAS